MKHREVEQQAYSSTEAARLLGISRTALFHAVAKGQLPSIRVGKLILLPKAQLDRMLGLTETPAA